MQIAGEQTWSETDFVYNRLVSTANRLRDDLGVDIEAPQRASVEAAMNDPNTGDAFHYGEDRILGRDPYFAAERDFRRYYEGINKARAVDPSVDVLSIDTLRGMAGQEAARLRKQSENVTGRASGVSQFAAGAGSETVRYFNEPSNVFITAATLPIAIEGFATSVLGRLALTAAFEGGVGLTTEAVVQEQLVSFYERQGMSPDKARSYATQKVLEAGVGGAVGGAVLRGSVDGISALLRKLYSPDAAERVAAAQALRDKGLTTPRENRLLDAAKEAQRVGEGMPENFKAQTPAARQRAQSLSQAILEARAGEPFNDTFRNTLMGTASFREAVQEVTIRFDNPVDVQAERVAANRATTVDEYAYKLDPTLISEWRQLQSHYDWHMRTIDELLEPQQRAQADRIAKIDNRISELEGKIPDSSKRRAKIQQAEIERLTAERAELDASFRLATTPDVTRLRSKAQEIDYKLRSLAPDRNRVYAQAEAAREQAIQGAPVLGRAEDAPTRAPSLPKGTARPVEAAPIETDPVLESTFAPRTTVQVDPSTTAIRTNLADGVYDEDIAREATRFIAEIEQADWFKALPVENPLRRHVDDIHLIEQGVDDLDAVIACIKGNA